MICTIYSHQTGFQQLQDTVKAVFPRAKLVVGKLDESELLTVGMEGGLFKKGSQFQLRYRQRERPSHQLPEEDNSPLVRNLKGLYGYVSQLPSHNEAVKRLFLHKIVTLNSECSIAQTQGETRELPLLIARLAEVLDAVLFVQPGTPISRASTQHFLDKQLRLLLDQQGNCDVDHLEVKMEAGYLDGQAAVITEDQAARKAQSERILEARQIKVNKHLPCVESEAETQLRSPRAIAQRATVLAVTNLVAFGQFSGEDAIHYLQRYHLWNQVTPNEQAFLADPTEERKSQETWKCEDIWTLLWALQQVDKLPFPDALCNLSELGPDQYPLGANKDPNDFIDAVAGVRSKQEILDANDLYYRLDWACVDARLHGREMSQVHPGVVYERHYALNWLIQYRGQEWDDVSCDT